MHDLNTSHLNTNPLSDTVPPRSGLLERFAAVTAAHGESLACCNGEACLTYAELDALSDDLASRLAAHSGSGRHSVALYLDRSCEVLVACLAAAKAGIAYVPLDPSWPTERLEAIAKQTRAASVVFASGQEPPLELQAMLHCHQAITRPDAMDDGENTIQTALPSTDENTPLYILFTSGSTGAPKGVVVTHSNVLHLATGREFPGFVPGRRITSCIPLSFDASVLEVWGGMLNGCAMMCTCKETFLDARRCKDYLARQRVDYVVIAAAVLATLLGQDTTTFKGVEKLITGGELPNCTLCGQMLATAPPKAFYNSYGPTECTVLATWEHITNIKEGEIVPAGHPLPTAYVRIVDENITLQPPGVWGEVLLGGAGVSAGYFNDPKKTAEAFVPDPADPSRTVYRTGDRGRLDKNGRLTISGRFDDQVKIAGMRVEPEEIRAVLDAAPSVRLSHVSSRSGLGLVAHVVLHLDHMAEPQSARQSIRAYLTERLPTHMMPGHIIFLPSLPLTSNGKIDSAALPLPATPSFPDTAEQDQPLQDPVLLAFRKVLHNGEYAAEDSFLSCGGSSLSAASLIGTLHHETGIWVPLELFSEPGTARLVRMFIESARSADVPAPHCAHEQVRL